MLNLELKIENCVSKNGTNYIKYHYIFSCSCCDLFVDVVDFNSPIAFNEKIENVVVVENDGRLEVAEVGYSIPWNYKTAVKRLYNHCVSCNIKD